ncbi:MAG: hypothetical protein R3A11_01450 [Bdellovibrionota bacterium]
MTKIFWMGVILIFLSCPLTQALTQRVSGVHGQGEFSELPGGYQPSMKNMTLAAVHFSVTKSPTLPCLNEKTLENVLTESNDQYKHKIQLGKGGPDTYPQFEFSAKPQMRNKVSLLIKLYLFLPEKFSQKNTNEKVLAYSNENLYPIDMSKGCQLGLEEVIRIHVKEFLDRHQMEQNEVW